MQQQTTSAEEEEEEEEGQSEEGNEGSYSLTSLGLEAGQREIVSQTIVTAL